MQIIGYRPANGDILTGGRMLNLRERGTNKDMKRGGRM